MLFKKDSPTGENGTDSVSKKRKVVVVVVVVVFCFGFFVELLCVRTDFEVLMCSVQYRVS